jgi:hypothetical protein
MKEKNMGGKHWMPGRRDGKLAMAKKWGKILSAKRADWNIPAAEVTELAVLTAEADAALIAATDEGTRTPVTIVQCRGGFNKLEAKMRDIKRRYFFVPPLTEADLANLGLRLPDTNHNTSLPAPTAEVTAETYLVGRRELGLKFVYITGDPGDRENKGLRIWYQVVAPGETAPTNPEQLHKSFFTKRKKDVLGFAYEDSGKTVYFAVQVENKGGQGKWGPMGSALIP